MLDNNGHLNLFVRRIICGEAQPAPNRSTYWWNLELQAFVTGVFCPHQRCGTQTHLGFTTDQVDHVQHLSSSFLIPMYFTMGLSVKYTEINMTIFIL